MKRFVLDWPYNFVAKFNTDSPWGKPIPIGYEITAEHEAAIMEALDTVEPKIREMILANLRDKVSMRELARRYKMSSTNTARVIRKAYIELWQDPVLRDQILYGKEIATKKDELRIKLRKLLAAEEELNNLLEQITMTRNSILKLFARDLDSPNTAELAWKHVKLEALKLSTRAYNMLKRAGYSNLGDVVRAAKDGKLAQVRGLGPLVGHEVLDAIKENTGEDYTDMNPSW